MSDNKRIAKNTVFLYIRMLFILGVSLYSSRVVLNILGADDYGLYNVVGGVVAMLSFLNGSISGAISRYLTFYLGKKDIEKYQQAFSSAFYIMIIAAIVIVLLAETLGIWFIKEKMIIDPERMNAALWVFHVSILSCFLTFFQAPYNASIIAHEKMNIYAYVGVIEATLKLLLLYVLSVCEFDKLKLYSTLMLSVSVIVSFIYYIYCKLNIAYCKIVSVKNWNIFKDILSYAGWDTIGCFAGIAQSHGINIILNLFFTTVVNAARGVAYQVDAALNNFITNFLTAIRPQMVKAYATKNIERMKNLINFGGKYALLMYVCMCMPIIIEADYILKIWLVNPPEYATIFVRLVLTNHIISIFNQILIMSIHAVGDVKHLNLYSGIINIFKLPIAYFILYLGFDPQWVFLSIIPMTFACMVTNILILSSNIQINLFETIKKLFLKNVLLIIPPTIATWFLSTFMHEGMARLIFVIIIFAAIQACTTILFGLNDIEKKKLRSIIKKVTGRI